MYGNEVSTKQAVKIVQEGRDLDICLGDRILFWQGDRAKFLLGLLRCGLKEGACGTRKLSIAKSKLDFF